MIKILHIVNNLKVNGRTRLLYDLIRLTIADFDHEIISLLRAGPYEKHIQYLDVNIFSLHLYGYTNKLKGPYRLLKEISRIKPDLCLTWSGQGNVLSLIPRMLGIPVIWTIHNAFKTWDSIFARLWLKLSALLSYFIPYKVVCCSRASFNIYAQTHAYCPTKLVLVQNGVDTQRFRPDPQARLNIRSELQIPLNEFVVAFPTRLSTGFEGRGQKDPATFLEAVSIAKKKEPNMRFLMFGPLIRHDNQELIDLLQETSTLGHVELLGYRDDVNQIFAASDVIAMSSMDEGLPLALLEAMACGAIPVCTQVAEIPAIVESVGLLVPKKDPVALAGAMIEIASLDQDKRRSLSFSAIDRVRRDYNVTSMSKSYAMLIRSAVARYE